MKAYYNEFDPKAAAWLRELIKAGLIAPGDVDERSITEIKPNDLTGYTQCHFFAGIGGWSYALKLAGWPETRSVWTGSPPCQENSLAASIWGRRDGLRGQRSGLAHTWLDLVESLSPGTVFFENVPGIAPWLAEIEGRLAGLGYVVSRSKASAGSIGAPHLRRRVWLVADSNGKRLEEPRPQRPSKTIGEPWRTTPRNAFRADHPGTRRLVDGFSSRVDLVRAFGNSIVPQVAAEFIKAYLEVTQ